MSSKHKYNLTFEETSERFDVSMRTLFRWSKCLEGCTERKPHKTKIDMDALALDVQKYPDAFNYERAKRLNVGVSTVFDALKRLGISRKKNSKSSKSKRRRAKKIQRKDKIL